MTTASNKRSVMTIFSGESDLYSHQSRIVLAEKGVNVELILTNKDYWPDEIAELNPKNEVPVLVDR